MANANEQRDKVIDTTIELIDTTVDKGLQQFATGKLSDAVSVLSDLNQVQLALVPYRLVQLRRAKRFSQSVQEFLRAARDGGTTSQMIENLIQTYGREKIIDEVIAQLSDIDSTEKSSVVGFLFAATASEEMSYESFEAAVFAVKQVNPVALRRPASVDESVSVNGGDYRLICDNPDFYVAAGLAYGQVENSVPQFDVAVSSTTDYFLNAVGYDLVKHGIMPYQNEQEI